jgi:hypothetical protein
MSTAKKKADSLKKERKKQLGTGVPHKTLLVTAKVPVKCKGTQLLTVATVTPCSHSQGSTVFGHEFSIKFSVFLGGP